MALAFKEQRMQFLAVPSALHHWMREQQVMSTLYGRSAADYRSPNVVRPLFRQQATDSVEKLSLAVIAQS